MTGGGDNPGVFVGAEVLVKLGDGVSVANGKGVFDGSMVWVTAISGIAGRHELKRIIIKNRTIV